MSSLHDHATVRALVLVFVVALAARVAWWPRSPLVFPDSLEYLKLARSLESTGTYALDGRTPTSYKPPLYPAVLAVADRVTGNAVSAVIAVQCVAGALAACLVCLLATGVFGRRTGRISGLMFALAPMSAYFATLVLTETLFTALVVAAVWAWTRGRDWWAGACSGAGMLLRAILLPLPVVLAIAAIFSPVPVRRRLARVVAAALLVVSPWVARNVVAVGTVTVADGGVGLNLFYGTVELRPGSNRTVQLEAATTANGLGRPTVSPAAGDALARDIALGRIARDPVRWLRARATQYPWLFVGTGDYLPLAVNEWSFASAWRAGRIDAVAVELGFLIQTLLLVVAAAIGWWRSRRLDGVVALWAVPAFFAVVHLALYVEPRYGLPIAPFTIIFAAASMTGAVARPGGGARLRAGQPDELTASGAGVRHPEVALE